MGYNTFPEQTVSGRLFLPQRANLTDEFDSNRKTEYNLPYGIPQTDCIRRPWVGKEFGTAAFHIGQSVFVADGCGQKGDPDKYMS